MTSTHLAVPVPSTSTSTSLFPPSSKRSACDRCRSQKLRCSPRGPGKDSCSRCARVGARCHTSYYPASTTAQLTSPVTTYRSAALPTPILPKKPKSGAQARPTPINILEEDTTTSNDTCDPSSLIFVPEHENHSFNDIFDYQTVESIFNYDDSLNLLESASSEESHNAPQLYHDFPEFLGPAQSSSQSQFPAVIIDNDVSMDYTEDPTIPNTNHKATPQPQSDNRSFTRQINQGRQQRQPLSINDKSHDLSSLSLVLTKRLQQCMAISDTILSPSRPSETKAAPLISADGDTHMRRSQEGIELQMSANMFGDALNDTSEFLIILQSYASSGPGTPQRISIIVILNLLSAYLQIVAIFERLFWCLCKQLFDNNAASPASFLPFSDIKTDETRRGSESISDNYCIHITPNNNDNNSAGIQDGDGVQTLPGLRIAGFSVSQGNLQTKILVHAILHQFEMIERVLGLTDELRVTDKRGEEDRSPSGMSNSGLFDQHKSARALLEAVSTGNQWGCHNQQQVTATIEDDKDNFGLKALSSLREMINRVRVFLNM
ncbi:hypothetical protein F5884DRAFT_826586 [Xylogone sp. PMI_703]|nr:hypothetical protein F5884DRAFT_826586 [Xylogone sp. PMI_703]